MTTTPATQAILPVTLKERRERLGLTLRDVEEISKGAISNSYLSQLETGKIKNPSLENARTLATIYHCQTDDIAEALSLPILTALLRCHCCGQSLYNAKFITDAAPVQAHSIPGDVGVREALRIAMDGLYQVIALDHHNMGAESASTKVARAHVLSAKSKLAALTPSALSGDAGEEAFQAGFSAGFSEGMNEGMPGHKPVFCDDAWKAYIAALPSHKGAGE